MSKRLSTLFLHNKYLLFLSLAVIVVAGLSALRALPRQEDPRITNRNPFVITFMPGASAERVDTLVTEKIENRLEELAEIKTLESFSRAGVSLINVELEDAIERDTNQQVFSKVRDKVKDAIPDLPPEALEPVVDDRRNAIAFTLVLGLTWELSGTPELGVMNRLAEDLADRLRAVPGTELVRLYGAPDEEITVAVGAAELAALGLDAASVARIIDAADSKLPAGALRGDVNMLMEVDGELDSAARIADIPLVGSESGSLVRIGDVAEVRRDWQSPRREIGLADGRPSIFVAARMDSGLRIDQWSETVGGVVAGFRDGLGQGVRLDTVFDQQTYTSARLFELASNLAAGAAVVALIVFFMMGWRSALIVGSALPLTTALVLFTMQVTGGAIHQISVYGIIVALGLLIDNAIVTVDDVGKLLRKGKTRTEAVRETVGHLFLPLGASTLTTVLAFAPIVLLPGAIGDFVGDIGRSVILALVFSFVLAMTVIAAFAGMFGDRAERGPGSSLLRTGVRLPGLSSLYRRGLSVAFQAPIAGLVIACFLPMAGFLAARSLGNEFFPPVDRNMFEVRIWYPAETAIENTFERTRAIETVMREHEGVEHVYWLVGGSFPRVYYNQQANQDNVPGYAQATMVTDSAERTAELVPELQRSLDARFPGAQIVVRQFNQGPPVDADIEYRLYGPSLERLQALGEELRLALQQHRDVVHTQATITRDVPKLWFDADEDQVRLAGLTLSDVAAQLQANLEGGVGGSVLESLEEVPVRVRYVDATRGDLSEIASTNLVAGGGEWIPLSSLGTLELRPEMGGITRVDGRRTNIVKAFTRDGSLPIDVTYEILDELETAGFSLPDGYSMELGGFAEADSDATGNLAIYIPVLVTLMVSVLILTFRSLRLAALLGVIAVLSAGLGFLATWSISYPISFNTMLGILGLIGVAFNDSIVVLAAIRSNPAARAGDPEAVADQVMGTSRHVFSTTLTTIGGFLPLLLFVGGQFWPGLAIVLAGGVAGATIIAVLLVPSAYVLMHRKRARAETIEPAGLPLPEAAR